MSRSPRRRSSRKIEPCKSNCCKSAKGKGAVASSTSPRKGINKELLKVTKPSTSCTKDLSTCTTNQQRQDQSIMFVENLSDLNKIATDDNVQLAVWRNSSPPKFTKALSNPTLTLEDLPTFDGLVPAYPGMVAEVMKRYIWMPYKLRSRKSVLDEGEVDELVQHVDRLVNVFAEIVVPESAFVGDDDDDDESDSERDEPQLTFIHVKLEAIDTDGCRFWHQDSVSHRMLTTYRGPCTEYVPPNYSRATLKQRQFDSEHAQSLSHCDVAVFKGRGDNSDAVKLYDQPGIVHRSPRTEGSGVCRLLLVIDIPKEGWHM